MSQIKTDLVVTVQSTDETLNNVVVTTINESLTDAGFANVTVVETATGEPAAVPELETVLDYVRASQPQLFECPIQIRGYAPAALNLDDAGAAGEDDGDDDGEQVGDAPEVEPVAQD